MIVLPAKPFRPLGDLHVPLCPIGDFDISQPQDESPYPPPNESTTEDTCQAANERKSIGDCYADCCPQKSRKDFQRKLIARRAIVHGILLGGIFLSCAWYCTSHY